MNDLNALTSPMIHIVQKGLMTNEEIEALKSSRPDIEVITETEYARRVNAVNREAFLPYLNELRSLGFSQKLEWYAKRNSQEIVYLGNNLYFQRYWKWHVLVPMRIKRFYYQVKNFKFFKHYPHISEMKEKIKKHSI